MTTFKRDHSEFTQDGITIKGDYNTIRGKNCTIIGDYNHIHEDGCIIKGEYNHIYSKNCNVYGDYNHDHGSNNYLGKGDFSKGPFMAATPFSAVKQEPVQYVERSNSGPGLVNAYELPYEKKLNFELPDQPIQFGSSQLLTVKEETNMSSNGKKVELTTADKMQAITEKVRRATAKPVKDDADNAVIEALEILKGGLEKIRVDAETGSKSLVDFTFDEVITKENDEEEKKKNEKKKKAEDLIKKAEERQKEKKRQLEEEDAAKKMTDDANMKNLGALAGLLAQMTGGGGGGGGAPTATASAPAPSSK